MTEVWGMGGQLRLPLPAPSTRGTWALQLGGKAGPGEPDPGLESQKNSEETWEGWARDMGGLESWEAQYEGIGCCWDPLSSWGGLRQFSHVHTQETFLRMSQIELFILNPYLFLLHAPHFSGWNCDPLWYLGSILDTSLFFAFHI